MPETATISPADLAKKVETLGETQKRTADALEKLVEKSATSAEQNRRGFLSGAPNVRRGENSLTSRGYSYVKLVQAMTNVIDRENARVEIDMHNALQKLYVDKFGFDKAEKNSILVPLSSELMATACPEEEKFASEMGQIVRAGVNGLDPYEYAQYRKTLSWTDESALGSTVAPPMQGELIDLLRNNEVFLNAGAKQMAMAPNGRMVYPRLTGPSSAYHVGESVTITESEPTSGDLTLTAKKLAALVKIPNELFRFSSVNVEALLRDDVAKVAALKMDSALLQGVGSSVAPKGLIYYAGIGTHTASTVGADGNTFEPEDVALMVTKVEEANAKFGSFIMRPLMWSALVNRRADAVVAGDRKGPFMFSYLRGLEQDFTLGRMDNTNLIGHRVLKSTNISNARSKGSATNLSYILGGDFSDYVVAMSAVMEFAISTQGDSPFTKDQTWLRGILHYDGGPRHEASFILCDSLKLS